MPELPPPISSPDLALGTGHRGDRPWTPVQLVAAAFLFGPAAAGVAAGINAQRLGRNRLKPPSVAIGIVGFFILAGAMMTLPESALKPVGMIINFGIGIALMAMQKGAFDAWKQANWRPAKADEPYRPSRVGFLFLVSIGVLIIEAGLLFVMLRIAGKI